MTCLYVRYSKGQMKIQQMAFVLVAIMVFLGMVALIFFTMYLSDLREKAGELQEREAIETAKKISSSPEFIFGGKDCSSCIDLDKVFILSRSLEYKKFWNLDYLVIEKVSNKTNLIECNGANYPYCDKITIIENLNIGLAEGSFVSLARWDSDLGASGNFRYELGRIYASGRNVEG